MHRVFSLLTGLCKGAFTNTVNTHYEQLVLLFFGMYPCLFMVEGFLRKKLKQRRRNCCAKRSSNVSMMLC